MDDSNGNVSNEEKVGRLQQMSEEMKLHIAQLKAELGSAGIGQHGMQDLEKEFRNKAVASALIKKLESERQSPRLNFGSAVSTEASTQSNPGKGLAKQKVVVEPLHKVLKDSNAHLSLDNPPRKVNNEIAENVKESFHKTDGITDVETSAESQIFPTNKIPSISPNLEQTSEQNSTEPVAMQQPDRADNEIHFSMDDPGNQRINREQIQNLDLTQPDLSNETNLPASDVAETQKEQSTSSESSRSRSERSKSKIPSSTSRPTKSKSAHNDSSAPNDSPSSSPRSSIEPNEDSVPVRYLQMSSNSSKIFKKPRTSHRFRNHRSSSTPSTSRQADNHSVTVDLKRLSKYSTLEAHLSDLQAQCEFLAEENIRARKEQRAKAEEKINLLKKKNGELANLARRLEEKARSLQEQNVKKTQDFASVTRDLQQQKRTHHRHRARWEAEQARSLAEYNDHLISSRKQLDDLKKALKQARREKIGQHNDKCSEDEPDIIRQNQKELLQLQKLAAAASAKVVVRSLSTPVTARQKILEESNRTLRRQVTSLENNLQEVEGKLTRIEVLEEQLLSEKEEKLNLQNSIEQLKASTATLKSELQESKVETSDISLQLTDLKHTHAQLQEEYSTVHEQLAVAIQERDKAVQQCVENAGNISEMETTIKELYTNNEAYQNLQVAHKEVVETHHSGMSNLTNSHQRIVSDYQEALMILQAKVTQLEQQCYSQDETNKTLKKQLSALMEMSKANSEAETNLDKQSDNKNTNTVNGVVQKSLKSVGNPSAFATNNDSTKNANAHSKLHQQNLSSRRPYVPPIATKHLGSNEVLSGRQRVEHSRETDDTEAEDFEEEISPHSAANLIVLNDTKTTTSALKVYIAKYTYNPFEGPNMRPELELPLTAGDYVYVHGNMDGDGFYQGELMNGRRGLVPSNFLEVIDDSPNDLPPSYDAIVDGGMMVDDYGNSKRRRSSSRDGSVHSGPKHRSVDSELNHSMCSNTSLASNLHNRSGDHQLTSSSDIRSPGILPYPRKLRIDKKLSHSLIIGWVAPQLGEDDLVEEYHVIVDGQLSTIVSGSKSKAVVENIYHDKKLYQINVCAVTEYGRSDPCHCVINHGAKGSDLQISGLCMEHVTTTSARVAWKPVNSNFVHSISIGELEDEGKRRLTYFQRQIIVPSPMYQHTITGLKANTLYEMVLKTRSTKHDIETTSAPLRFSTLVIGPPDPPLSVSVEEDAISSEFLTVTWLPVTIHERGSSNDVIVSGYSVLVNSVNFASVEPSTSDQCRISMQSLSEHVRKVVDNDASYKHQKNNSSSSLSSNSFFSNTLPSIKITVKTIGENGQMSDDSAPHHLHKNMVAHLLKMSNSKEKRPASPGSSVKRKKEEESNAAMSGGFKSKLKSLVPAIEITQHSSSDDELSKFLRSRKSSAPNTPSTVHQTRNTNKKSDVSSLRQSRETTFSDKSGSGDSYSQNAPPAKLRSKSDCILNNAKFSGSDVNLLNNSAPAQHLPLKSHSDDESASSGGQTSSSTTGSLSRKQYVSGRSSWTQARAQNAQPRGSRKRGSLRNRIIAQDKRSNSSHSVYSDATDKDSAGKTYEQNDTRHHTAGNRSRRESMLELENVDDSRVSLYVALFNYEPSSMSPNIESFEEELTFQEGQFLKIYGDKDSDGFYLGETHHGNRGYVPCNMISLVEVDDYSMLEDLFRRGRIESDPFSDNVVSTNISEQLSDHDEPQNPSPPDKYDQQPLLYVALYDYDPKESSPNIDAEIELSFSRGDFIKVYGSMDEDGFFRGELDEHFGLVPSNFLEEVTNEQADDLKRLMKSTGVVTHKVSATTMTDTSITASPKTDESPLRRSAAEPSSVASTSSSTSSKTDSSKKKGIFSKGKKLFKKLGSNEPKNKR
ncbi:peripheral-type benzodiazepine receptor-associated protein 1-like isoform X2 [Clavelina lepadiformis]|uniref:peripheral-type benzodiazepine receptor-associated protein 1-like isoform X2 n=1 Tax=Clavelina lepadiformis TaxID=159417 RepID=UPI0040428196